MEEIIVIVVVIGVAVFIFHRWYKSATRKSGKSNGSVNMPEGPGNNEGEQSY